MEKGITSKLEEWMGYYGHQLKHHAAQELSNIIKESQALSLSDVSNNEPKGEVKVCECLNPQPYRGDNGKVMCFSCDGVYD